MQKTLKYIRRALFSLFLVVGVFYGTLYILLCFDGVQQHAKNWVVAELSERLHTNLEIKQIQIQPFNKVALHHVFIPDQQKDTLLFVENISASFRWYPLLQKRLEFSTVRLIGFNTRINRETSKSPLNIQFLLDAFASKDTVKRDFPFDLQVNTVLLHHGSIQYDITTVPEQSNRFDKNHLLIKDLFATISLHTLSKDSLNLSVKRLGFADKSGFTLNNLGFSVTANRKETLLHNLSIEMPASMVQIDSLKLDYAHVNKIEEFADSALFVLNMNDSKITLADIGAFVPALKNFNMPLYLSLSANGSLNQIEIPKLSVCSDQELMLFANASLIGITRPSEAYLFGKINQLTVAPKGLNQIINGFSSSERTVPQLLKQIGTIQFNGNISGFFTNLVAFGKLESNLGVLHSDLMLSKDFKKKMFTCKGSLNGKNLKIHKLIQKKDLLGEISLGINLDLSHQKGSPVNGYLQGNISSFDLKGYRYENLALNGAFKGKSFDGSIILNDENARLTMNGKIDVSAENSLFNFSADAKHVRLDRLKLVPKYENSELSFRMDANFTGDQFDNSQGYVQVDSLLFQNNGEQFLLDQIRLTAFNHETPQVLRLESDLLNAQLRGRYSFGALTKELMHTLGQVLPVMEQKCETQQLVNDFEFALQMKETSSISKILELPATFQQPVSLMGFYNSDKNILRVNGDFPKFRLGKFRFEDGQILADMPDDKLRLRFHTRKLDKKNQPLAISLNAVASDGKLTTRFDWSNLSETTYSGNITSTFFFKRRNGKYPIRTQIEVMPSVLIFNDSLWHMQPSEALIDSGRIQIDNFEIYHGAQHLRLNGTISPEETDTLRLNLRDMSLDYIFQTLNMNFIMFGGLGTGEFLVSNQNNVPVIKTDSLKVKDFTYNGTLLGDLKLYSDFDTRTKGIGMRGTITQRDANPTIINGGIFLGQDSLWLNFNADRLNIGFVHIWTDKILANLNGRASGDLTLFGKFRGLNLVGDALGENVNFGIDYLNTVYSISDSIHFNTDGISFKDVRVHDRNQTEAFANGKISYHHFKDIAYDITFLIPENRPFQVFNVTEKINPVYWGTIAASGSAHIYGNTEKTWIDVSAKSNANSRFNFSLSENVTAGDYQFITFRDANARWKQKNDSISSSLHAIHKQDMVEKEHELFLNLQMEATPDVTINLIMDPATGDMIKGTGSGNIRLEYNKTSDFKLYGNYTIDKGNYYFNLQDVIMRDFTISQGSTVTFRGQPLNAELDIDAIYQVTANLTDLDESFAESRELSRPTVPVQCKLNINGDLRRPDLSFDINLPTVSQDIDRQVKSIISTDDMMNRQILYLLILNKFYTPEYINNGQQNRYNELASMASSTLSSQLNNLLGQISDNWNIGTNIRSDKGDFSDVEVELALSSQLLNNRLLFNGNLGYRDNPNANNSFIGDFDLEYLLNPAGSLRLKAYNHYNDRNYSVKSALTTQGVGIMFKKDFNSLSDLFNVWLRKKNKKKTTDSLIRPSSIKE